MKFNKSLLGAAAALALVLSAPAANAVSIDYTFNLNAPGLLISGADYGTVHLATNLSGGVDFTITLRDDLNFVTTGNTGSHALFGFNATGVSLADISNIHDAAAQTFSAYAPATGSHRTPPPATSSLHPRGALRRRGRRGDRGRL